MTTTKAVPSHGGQNEIARGAVNAAPRPRWAGLLASLPVLLILGAGAWTLWHLPQYQEHRLSRMSLAQLQRERAGRLDDPQLLFYVGQRLNAQRRYAEADPYLRNAVSLDPDSPRLRDAWMQALLGSGLTTAAFGETREFVGTHENSAPAHLILGKFYVAQDSMIRAVEELSRAATLDPKLGEAWSLLAVAQNGLGHVTEAEAAAEQAVALRPRSAPDRLGLALLLARQGRREKALASFEQAAALDPASAGTHQAYARYLLTTAASPDDARRAEAEARQALALNAADLDAPLTLGQALAAQGRVADGLPFLLQAARLSPYDPAPALAASQAYYRLGQAGPQKVWQAEYQARQRRASAEADLVTSILKSPTDARPQRRLARMLAEEGDVAGCLRHQAKALRCAPDAPPAQAAAAEDLTATGHAAQALPLAQRAVMIAPSSPVAQEALGDTLLALDRPAEAARSYSKSAREDPAQIRLFQARMDRYGRAHEGAHP